MKEKMTFTGTGPGIALISIPYVTLAIYVYNSNPAFLKLVFIGKTLAGYAGYGLIALGLLFYFTTIYYFLSDFKKGKLVTKGPFSLCRNPLYASIIILIIPGVAMLFQSGIILSIAFVMYINFKAAIHGEERILSRNFGESYEAYKKSVNEIIPIPRFWKNSPTF